MGGMKKISIFYLATVMGQNMIFFSLFGIRSYIRRYRSSITQFILLFHWDLILVVDLYSIRRSKILQIILILDVSEFFISIIKQTKKKKKIFVRQIASRSCTARVKTGRLIALKCKAVAVTKGVTAFIIVFKR